MHIPSKHAVLGLLLIGLGVDLGQLRIATYRRRGFMHRTSKSAQGGVLRLLPIAVGEE